MTLQVDTSQTVTDDQFDATGCAIAFITNPDITVTIDTNVSVISEGDYTVYSNVVGSTLINNGSILSTASYGVEFDAASGSVVNDASGLILGVLEGVEQTITPTFWSGDFLVNTTTTDFQGELNHGATGRHFPDRH